MRARHDRTFDVYRPLYVDDQRILDIIKGFVVKINAYDT